MTSHWGASAYDTFDFESREMVTTKLPTAESLPPYDEAAATRGLRPPLRIADPPSASTQESTSPYQRDDGLSDDEAFAAFANRFAALSSPTRVKLAVLLCRHPAGTECGRVLAASVGLAETTVSHHLRLLRSAGLIDSQRRGMSIYHFASPELRHLYRTLISGSDWK
jgi:DNA-binding transcriptional ArsR family regulator